MSDYAPVTPEVIAFLHKWTPRGICEIGAGDGSWLTVLNQQGINAIGYDINPLVDEVRLGTHVDATEHSNMAMLAVWPPDGRVIQDWIRAWCGDTIIICGQFSRFDVGDALNDFIGRDFMSVPGGRKGASMLAVYTRI